MFKTYEKGDIRITLKLNDNGSVNLQTRMEVDYPGIDDKLRYPYPDAEDNIGTVDMQFDFIQAGREFDAAYQRRKVGERIRQLREEKGWSQQELADRAKLKRQNLARIETGKYSTGQDILSQVAVALGKELKID